MRKIRLDEVHQATKKLQTIVPYDTFCWLLIWKEYEMEDVDFDLLDTIHAMTTTAAQGFFVLCQVLKLSVTLIQEDEEANVTHKFEKGLHVFTEVCKGEDSSWEKKEYNEFGQILRKEYSSGKIFRYKYNNGGSLTDVLADDQTKDVMEDQAHVDISEDGGLLEIAM